MSGTIAIYEQTDTEADDAKRRERNPRNPLSHDLRLLSSSAPQVNKMTALIIGPNSRAQLNPLFRITSSGTKIATKAAASSKNAAINSGYCLLPTGGTNVDLSSILLPEFAVIVILVGLSVGTVATMSRVLLKLPMTMNGAEL